jgi:hypothetical protein
MNRALKNISRFVILILLQVLVFNNISLWGYLTPYPFLFFLLLLRVDMNRTTLLFIGFFTGLTLDIFQNTLGMQAAATTAMVFARPFVISFYFRTAEFLSNEEPNINKLKFTGFLKYVFTLVFIHNLVLFFLEAFAFHGVLQILEKVTMNALVTTASILIIEMVFTKRE